MPIGAPPTKPRLDLGAARGRAAKACGVDASLLTEPKEHSWGFSFRLEEEGDAVFVDAATGLVATSDDDAARTELLHARGPLGVPPWSPPQKRSWWSRIVDKLRA